MSSKYLTTISTGTLQPFGFYVVLCIHEIRHKGNPRRGVGLDPGVGGGGGACTSTRKQRNLLHSQHVRLRLVPWLWSGSLRWPPGSGRHFCVVFSPSAGGAGDCNSDNSYCSPDPEAPDRFARIPWLMSFTISQMPTQKRSAT